MAVEKAELKPLFAHPPQEPGEQDWWELPTLSALAQTPENVSPLQNFLRRESVPIGLIHTSPYYDLETSGGKSLFWLESIELLDVFSIREHHSRWMGDFARRRSIGRLCTCSGTTQSVSIHDKLRNRSASGAAWSQAVGIEG